MALKTNLNLDQGTDFEFRFDMLDDNDELIDLTNYTGIAEMRKYYTSATGYEFNVSINANTSEVILTMNNSTTSTISAGRYMYDCELTDGDGKVSRIIEGIVTVNPRVIKSV